MNNIDEKTCRDCKKVFTLPANGFYDNGQFLCMDCIGKIDNEFLFKWLFSSR